MTTLETIPYRGGRIEIHDDNEPSDPRWDTQNGIMVCWHPDYTLGDEQITRDELREALEPRCRHCRAEVYQRDGEETWRHSQYGYTACAAEEAPDNATADRIEAYKRRKRATPDDPASRLPRFLAERFGAIASTIKPLWLLDHSGLAMSTGAFGCDPGGWDSGVVGFIFATPATMADTGTPLDIMDECLTAEVQEYDDYLRGNVVGYVAKAPDGMTVGSCWGFYPDRRPEIDFDDEWAYVVDEVKPEIDAWWDELNARTGGRALMVAGRAEVA